MANAFRKLWLVIRWRALFKCPICDGAGGAMEGYYEPEWSECECYYYWESLEDWGLTWFVGRLPLLPFVRASVSRRLLKIEYILTFQDIARCFTGFHRWMPREYQIQRNQRICAVCFQSDRPTNQKGDRNE